MCRSGGGLLGCGDEMSRGEKGSGIGGRRDTYTLRFTTSTVPVTSASPGLAACGTAALDSLVFHLRLLELRM